MAIVCPRCQKSIEPTKVYEQSKANGKEWVISRCPYERCGFNLDIEPFNKQSIMKHRHDLWPLQ